VGSSRVVVADADRRSSGVLAWMLTEKGIEATAAHPPNSVELALEWRTPEVLLVDGDDPELVALVKRIGQDRRYQGVRIIAAVRPDPTGVGQVPDGAHDCVEKPYRAHEVLTRVQMQLRTRTELAAARNALSAEREQSERGRDSSETNRRLAEVLRDVSDELSTPEIYRVLARRVGRALDVRHCAVILAHDREAHIGTATVVAAIEEPRMSETTISLLDYPEIARALSTGRPLLVEDAGSDPIFAEIRSRANSDGRPFSMRSVIALPFAMEDATGALFIRTEPGDRALTKEDVEFAELVMHAAVAAIRRGQALEMTRADNRRLEELATTDPLTRTLNRRALIDRLSVEMDRAIRFRADLSILLLDVDYFKRVNDTAGHLAGDEVLRQIAGLLEEEVRRVDIVARYGGEEFVLILPETGKEGAGVFGERIRQRIEGYAFGEESRNIRLTVSVGIATFPSTQIASTDDFFARADEALYRAKANGRNQVRS
jgi:two-component system cell cycle response regulator